MSSPNMDVVHTSSQISYHPTSENSSASHHLIFFITGNPGLVSYYTTFLSTLNTLLSGPSTSSPLSAADVFHLYSQSLAGFDQEPGPSLRATPYSLEEQIQFILEALKTQKIPSGPLKNQLYTTITLIGHSVGAYILLELITRLRKSSSPLNIRAGILLFPTVINLAQSPRGLNVAPIFKRIPNLARKVSVVAKGLLWLAPRNVVEWLVRIVAGMPSDAAKVTTGFLKSPMGIWQALHLAKDEMDTITEDKWDEDIWGIEHEDLIQKSSVPKLIFYFGESDYWVAAHTRDDLIAARGKGEEESGSKPVMLVDENAIPHAFCLAHSEPIAEKVKLWIGNTILNS